MVEKNTLASVCGGTGNCRATSMRTSSRNSTGTPPCIVFRVTSVTKNISKQFVSASWCAQYAKDAVVRVIERQLPRSASAASRELPGYNAHSAHTWDPEAQEPPFTSVIAHVFRTLHATSLRATSRTSSRREDLKKKLVVSKRQHIVSGFHTISTDARHTGHLRVVTMLKHVS